MDQVARRSLGLLLLLGILLAIVPQASTPPQAHAAQDPIDPGLTDPLAKVNATYARGASWTLVANPDGSFTWANAPDWIYNGSRYVPLIFEDHYAADGYYQVQGALIGARIYDTYARFYDPQLQEVRVYNEQWEVERWSNNKWASIGVASGSLSWEVTQTEDFVNVSRSSDTWAGIFRVDYIFRAGQPLKHTITWTSELASLTEFRVIQAWGGISAAKCRLSDTSLVNETALVNSTVFYFLDSEGQLAVGENQEAAVEWLQPTSVEAVTGNEMKVDYVFESWTLAQGQTLEIDPSTWTSDEATDDSYIENNAPNDNNGAVTVMKLIYDHDASPFPKINRLCVMWDISALPSNILVSSLYIKLWHSGHYGDAYEPIETWNTLNHTFDESTVNWNNQPTLDTELDTTSQGDTTTYTNITDTSGYIADYLQDRIDASADDFALTFCPDESGTHYTSDNYGPSELVQDVGPYLTVTYILNSAPTITSASITDMDDTDNIYAKRKGYSFQVVVNDADGATDISKVHLRAKDGAATVWEVQANSLDGTPAWSIASGSSIINLWTGTCSWAEDGNSGTATFKVEAEGDHTQYDDLELAVYVEDSAASSAGWTDKQTNYFDVITRLVTDSVAATDSRINVGGTATISGNVRYATTTSGNTASSFSPPDGQFTAVRIHDASHSLQGSDTSISSGAFSVSFSIPSSVQSNTYHVYLDMVADFSDGDAPDGDTASVIGDRIKILSIGAVDGRINVDSQGTYWATAELEYDSHSLASGDSFTLSGLAFSWDGVDLRFEATDTKASVQAQAVDSFTSGSEATHGITVGNINGQSGTIIWDQVDINTLSVNDGRIPLGQSVSLNVAGIFSYDSSAWSGVATMNETLSPGSVGLYGYSVASITDPTYGVTAFTQSAADVSCIIDRVNITGLTPTDSRINVGDTATIQATGVFQYDSSAWSGVATLNDTLTRATVGSKAFDVTSITDPTYGIDVFTQSAVAATVIWDKLTITLAPSDSRISLSSSASIVASITRQYDSSVSGATVTLNDTLAQAAVGLYGYTTTSVSGDAYGITVFESDSCSVIFDRIRITSLSAAEASVPLDTEVELRAEARLEYDNHSLGSGDWFVIDGANFSWDASDARFEASVALPTPQTVLYDSFTSGSEATYGISDGDPGSCSASVEWYGSSDTGSSSSSSSTWPTDTSTTTDTVDPGGMVIPGPSWIQQWGDEILVAGVFLVFMYAAGSKKSGQKKRQEATLGLEPALRNLPEDLGLKGLSQDLQAFKRKAGISSKAKRSPGVMSALKKHIKKLQRSVWS